MTNLPLDHCTIDGQQGLRRIDGVTDYVTTLRLFVRLGWLITQPSVYGASLHMPIVAVAGRFAEADFGILLKSALKNDTGNPDFANRVRSFDEVVQVVKAGP